MQEASREEMAALDPFEGRGVFLEARGRETDSILRELALRIGETLPAVAWGGIGVWVDPGSSGMRAVAVRDLWDGGKASEHG